MTVNGLRATEEHRDRPTATITLDGRLDALSAPDLRSELRELDASGCHNITIDLDDVEFVDSAGLAALVSAMKACRMGGGELTLVRPRSADAFRVFELAKFDAVFDFVER